ncbi:MAG: HAD family hydrolase [Candidatus ainarchaeum sp.]|nr:HAD family hydrolase [Candidatus ainarchaeum sp.]
MKAILLDVDGTLVNSIPLILESVKITINHFGFRISNQKLRELSQLHSREIALWLIDNKKNNFDLEQFIDYRRKTFLKLLKKNGCEWFNDSKSFILKVSKKHKIGIVTGSRTLFLKEIFDEEIKKNFNFIITSDEVNNKKPDIEPIQITLKKLKVKRHEVVFIGDSTQDALMCKRARIGFIGKTTGISTKRQLEKFKPIFIGKNFKEIELFLGFERN